MRFFPTERTHLRGLLAGAILFATAAVHHLPARSASASLISEKTAAVQLFLEVCEDETICSRSLVRGIEQSTSTILLRIAEADVPVAPTCDCWDILGSAHGSGRVDCDHDFRKRVELLGELLYLDHLSLTSSVSTLEISAALALVRADSWQRVSRNWDPPARTDRSCHVRIPEVLPAQMPVLPDRCGSHAPALCKAANEWSSQHLSHTALRILDGTVPTDMARLASLHPSAESVRDDLLRAARQ